jgi:hypothetical protein
MMCFFLSIIFVRRQYSQHFIMATLINHFFIESAAIINSLAQFNLIYITYYISLNTRIIC